MKGQTGDIKAHHQGETQKNKRNKKKNGNKWRRERK